MFWPCKLGERYLAELIVEPDSSWTGKEVNAEHFERDFDVDLIGSAARWSSSSHRRSESLSLHLMIRFLFADHWNTF